MQIRIPTLRVRDFEASIARSPFCLFRLEASARTGFHAGVGEFFATAYPGQFRFGTIRRSSIRDEAWLDNTFRSSTGRMRAGVRDGYYLFQGHVVAGHHLGNVTGSSLYESADADAQRQRVVQYGFMGQPPDDMTLESARQIIMYFDDIVARRTGTVEGERFEREESRSRRQESGPPPPRQPPPPRAPNPYEVLGLSPAATDAEIKAAYKAGVRMNHPDKVSHLSAALQKFAEAQVIEIIGAYETIRKERGS